MNFRRLIYMIMTSAVAILSDSCVKDQIDDYGMKYVEGVETYISLRVSVPAMDVATRADMPDGADFAVRSLWVGIFSARDKNCTYAAYHNKLPREEHGEFITLENIKTESGPSYIVAVANPTDNFGYLYKGGSVTREALDILLPHTTVEAKELNFTWDSYTNIAIRQLDLNDVNTPIGNLVMSGIYIDSQKDPQDPADWEDLCQKPFNIEPYSGVKTLGGAVHLRRLISQVRFHLEAVEYSGDNQYKKGHEILEIIPQSFQVRNVPYTSWLHERKGPSSVGETTNANSGDVIRISSTNNALGYDEGNGDMILKANYRSSVWFNGSQYLTPSIDGKSFDFDFWMLENKRWASYDLYEGLDPVKENDKAYDRREKEVKDSQIIQIPNEDKEGGYDNVPYDENLGIYLALCSSKLYDPSTPPTIQDVPETMNNCASFVEIRCRIIYTEQGLEDIRHDKDYEEVQYRSADAVYTIHLGGIGQNWNDFTHRRNHKYTYNVKIMDVDRIIVEARYDDEPRPGIEGVVTDVVNPPFEVDCHYAVFNIQLCNLERTGGGIIQTGFEDDPNTGDGTSGDHEINGGKYERGVFPFRIRYFDKNNFARYIDQSNIDEYMDKNNPDKNPLHWQWVELRPTTGKDVIADYKPYWDPDSGEPRPEFADGLTFRINEVADIKKFRHPDDHSTSKVYEGRPDEDDKTLHWYTVFVNEYVYETKLNEGENNFVNYVNLEPRMCWMNTLFRSSVDDESNYIRSKYVVRQQSIQTFYANIPHSTGDDDNDFNAIGMEHINETFGFNLRWDGVPTEFEGDDRTHNMQNNNGRHNTALYIYDPGHETRGELWTDYMNPNRLQFITGINKASNQYAVSYQLQESPYIEDTNNPKREPYYVPAIYTFPYRNIQDQTGLTDPVESRSNINTSQYLRIMDACMNRNRDNNGNGVIDIDEIRWYVPASSEIVDLVLGHYSLRTPLLDYDRNYYLASPGGPQNPSASGSQTEQNHQGNTRFHYATSNQRTLWAEEGATINPEADVPTGTWNLPPQNVRCVRALGTNLETDENKDLTPAFTTNASYTFDASGSRNYTKYATKIYPKYYEQKNQRSYSSIALEPHQERTGDLNRVCYNGFEFKKELLHFKPVTIQVWVESGERTIPEGWYADDGEYLGIPEWKEGGGERYPGGMYLPDPTTRSDKQFPGSQKFDGFWIGGEDLGGCYYMPDMNAYGGSDKDNPPTDGQYKWWDKEELPVESSKHEGAWYEPDVEKYGGADQNPPTDGQYKWWNEKDLPDKSTMHEGAWYEPDVKKYGGAGQNPPTDGQYKWWERIPNESTMHEGAWYEPDVTKYGGAGQNPSTDGQYKWWERFPDQNTYHPTAWFKPDLSKYGGAGQNPPTDGVYDWWEKNELPDESSSHPAGWYKPNPLEYSADEKDGYFLFDEFWEEYYTDGGYAPLLNTYQETYFDESILFSNHNLYKGGYYKPDMSTFGTWTEYTQYIAASKYGKSGKHPEGWYKLGEYRDGNQWNSPGTGYVYFEKFYDKYYDAGWYQPDVSDPAGNQYEEPQPRENRHRFNEWYDKYYDAGWYQPLESSRRNPGQPNNDPKNANPKLIHKWFDTWYDEYYPAGWYQPDVSHSDGNQWTPPNPIGNYKWFDTWYDKYYPSGWYQPLESSKTNVGNPNNNPKNSNPNSIHQWFDTWYDEYYEGGWYKPDLSNPAGDQWNRPNPMGTYKWFDEWHEGGTYYEEGYYGPDPETRTTDGNNYWNADPRYKRFETFYELPAGYYGSDGSYLGPNRNSAPDPAWKDRNPKWVEEHTEAVPEGGAYEDKFVEGLWQDASGTTRDLFAYNEGNFVRDHGTTLLAANKICELEYGKGWRLPNMKEASLIKITMDNAGIYKGQVDGGYLTHEVYHDTKSGYDVGNFIACTFREYGITGEQSRGEKTGYYTGIYYAEPGEAQAGDWSGEENNSPVLGRIACITTGWNRHFYIRCVRDLQSSGD